MFLLWFHHHRYSHIVAMNGRFRDITSHKPIHFNPPNESTHECGLSPDEGE